MSSLDEILSRHQPGDEPEADDLARIRAFVARHDQPFDRLIAEGHLTASALVLTPDGQRVLLLHHAKLRRWLQPGGHAEAGEAQAEAAAPGPGRPGDPPLPLDVDVHDTPPRGGEPAHEHLDLRYLVVAHGD